MFDKIIVLFGFCDYVVEQLVGFFFWVVILSCGFVCCFVDFCDCFGWVVAF